MAKNIGTSQVTTNASIVTRSSKESPWKDNVPWTGSSDSNSIWLSTKKARYWTSWLRLAMLMTGSRWNTKIRQGDLRQVVADKGYISQELFNKLLVNGIQLVTKIKNNMKNSLMSMADKILLRKRAFSPVRTQDDKAGVPASESRH